MPLPPLFPDSAIHGIFGTLTGLLIAGFVIFLVLYFRRQKEGNDSEGMPSVLPQTESSDLSDPFSRPEQAEGGGLSGSLLAQTDEL